MEMNSLKDIFQRFRVGIGYDVHPFAENRALILGGVSIVHRKGLAGHSDADVLTHAIMDALLGAAGLGDIGTHFSDRDMKYKDISSLWLLEKVADLIKDAGFIVINVDSIIICQNPKVMPYSQEMKKNLSAALGVVADAVHIKATTTEHLGFVGREEGIAAQAVASLYKLD